LQFGEHFLDSSNDDSHEKFSSIEELVLFGMSHELKVAGEEVILKEPVLCDMEKTVDLLCSTIKGSRRRRESIEDHDVLTDLFASIFGPHNSVLVVIHSCLEFDGNPLDSDRSYLVCVVKDNVQKGFFIRTIDSAGRELVGEKKITRHFEYDMPSELVMTFLSEHGITCIGFKDDADKEMFLRHLNRIIQLQQEKSIRSKVTDIPSSFDGEETEIKSPTELTGSLKAKDFDIYNLSPEWQYLFDQSGITMAMLEDQNVLQFILDTVYQMGGAPKKIQNPSITSDIQTERAAAIAVDSTLRHEAVRASRLADELRKCSLSRPQPRPRAYTPPTCTYSTICTRYKELLLQRNSLSAISPVRCHCYCSLCGAGKPVKAVSGTPPHQYTIPLGWCQFIMRSQTHSLAQEFCPDWHVAFSHVPEAQIPSIVRTGRLNHQSYDDNEAVLSPDIKWSWQTLQIKSEIYHDKVDKADFSVSTAMQVFVQPGSYSIDDNGVDVSQPLQQLWFAPERTYIIYALLIYIHPL
jgi:hypothetical protein